MAEYTPRSGSPWNQAQEAADRLNLVLAERIEQHGKLGSDDTDLVLASEVLTARSTLALADAIHETRKELSRVTGLLRTLSEKLDRLTDKFPAVG